MEQLLHDAAAKDAISVPFVPGSLCLQPVLLAWLLICCLGQRKDQHDIHKASMWDGHGLKHPSLLDT